MRFNKFWLAVLATIVQALIPVLDDDVIDRMEWVIVAIAAVNAVMVVVIPNLPVGGLVNYLKSFTAAAMAALTLMTTLLVDGTLSGTDWLNIGVAVLAALGIWAVPNASTPGARTNGSIAV